MVVQKWLLPSLSEILAKSEHNGFNDDVVSLVESATGTDNGQRNASSRRDRELQRVQREWTSAIATLEQLLLRAIASSDSESNNHDSSLQGLLLAHPAPVLSHPDLLARFQTGIFTTEAFNPWALMPFQLPPAKHESEQQAQIPNTSYGLTLLPSDPLASEQFCLVFTRHFSLVMVCGEDIDGIPAFRFSFDPDDIKQAWAALQPRLLLANPYQLGQLETLVKQFAPKIPDYRIVTYFSRQLLRNLPEATPSEVVQTIPVTSKRPVYQPGQSEIKSNTLISDRRWEPLAKNEERSSRKIYTSYSNNTSSYSTPQTCEATPDIELLQALTHEIRTPLTTIRTLTKLLLKRRDLPPEVIRRLEIIEHECTEQINRMELIFRAVELETAPAKPAPVNLTSMSLAQVFQHSIPRWQKQAARRNITLDVVVPQKLPTVVSNPAMLDQVLTGLIENFTRSLPSGGHIQVQVTPAGEQLKLQFQTQTTPEKAGTTSDSAYSTCSTFKSIGQLLMFQPETGSLCLNLDVTKHLFQALGGKLIVRQRPQEGEVMTIFLPLEVNQASLSNSRKTLVKNGY